MSSFIELTEVERPVLEHHNAGDQLHNTLRYSYLNTFKLYKKLIYIDMNPLANFCQKSQIKQYLTLDQRKDSKWLEMWIDLDKHQEEDQVWIQKMEVSGIK